MLWKPYAVSIESLLFRAKPRRVLRELVRQQYDQMVKYVTAVRLGTAETESIRRRFVRSNIQHPTYKAFSELGRAIKTIFLCQYLHSEALRREVNAAQRPGRFCCNVWLWWWISGRGIIPPQAATSNSAAMNSAWALMSLPLMFRTCPFLIIAIAS
jgi:Tn3 transposase DDE domain-containing protein